MADKTVTSDDIAAAARSVAACTEAFRNAKAEADAARKVEAAATNRLNDAQKMLDKVSHEFRTAAPFGSDWAAARRASEAV